MDDHLNANQSFYPRELQKECNVSRGYQGAYREGRNRLSDGTRTPGRGTSCGDRAVATQTDPIEECEGWTTQCCAEAPTREVQPRGGNIGTKKQKFGRLKQNRRASLRYRTI